MIPDFVPVADVLPQDGKTTAHDPDAKVRGRAANTDKWTLQFRDLPEVARQRPVTSRLIADTPIISGNPVHFMSALDYTCVHPSLSVNSTAANGLLKDTQLHTSSPATVSRTSQLPCCSTVSSCLQLQRSKPLIPQNSTSFRFASSLRRVRTSYRQHCGYKMGPR